MADFEPVEIDFMYGGNTQAEGARIIKTTEEIAAAQAKAKADVERHSNAIMELKKDLVGLGTAYKQAMSKQQKSEILTEIELTKKNIIDETAAVKQLKAELASLNKVPASSPALDAQKVGKAAVGYSSLSFSTQQLVRELPAATMGLNTFFLAISNNIPVLIDGIKRTKAEVESLKAKNIESVPVWKQLLSSLVSWQSAMMIGITIFAMYGKDIIAWGKELLTGEKAVKKLTDAQLGLTRANETMIASLNSGSEYKTAVTNIEKLSTALRQAKGNHELEKKAVDDYNGSLGETFGKAKNVDEALGMIARNKDAYIKAMQDMSFANAFFAKSADDAMKAMEVGLKSQQQILKESGADNIGLFEKWQAAVKETEDAKKKLDSMKAEGKDTFYTEKYYQSRLSNQNIFARQIQELEAKERARQLAAIRKHQEESLNLATNYYKSSIDIFKQNDWETEVADDKANKEKYNAKKAITDLTLDLEAQRSKMELEMQSDSLQKRLKAIDLEKAAEIRKIQEKEAAIVEAYNKSHKGEAGFTAKTTLAEVDPELAAKLSAEKDGISSAFDQKRFAAAEKWKNELLQLAQRYGDESARIEAEYNVRIQREAQDGFIIRAAELTKERDERLSALETSLIKETELYKLATTDQLNISKQLTSMLIAETRKRIQEDTKLTAADRDILLEKLNKADYIVQKTDNPFADLIDGVEKYRKAREEQSQYNAGLDLENFARLEDAANEAQKATLQATAGALQQVGSIIREITNELDDLTDAQRKTVNEIENILMGAATLAEGLATGNPATIASGSIQLLINLYKVLDTKARETEALLQRNKDAVEALNMAYDNLSDAIDKAFGTEKARLIQEQIELLKQKKAILEESRQIELSKDADYKKPKWWEYAIPGWNTYQIAKGLLRPKTDDAAVSEYTKEIAEIDRLIAQLAENTVIEAITGTSVMSAIDEFANAYADAFTSGENAALKSSEIVRNIIKKELVEKLKQQLQGPINELMKSIADAVATGSDGGTEITQAEKDAIEAKKKKIDELAAKNKKELEDLGYGDSTQKGIQGDVAKMTEQTGAALTGQITAMRFNVMQLLTNSKSSIDIMSRQLATLEEIKNNTAFCRKLERMDENINYLKINGIKVN